MVPNGFKKGLFLSFSTSLAFLAWGFWCQAHAFDIHITDEPRGGTVTVVPAAPGPPPHAPAHGYRTKYHYRYYPSNEVYYDTNRKLWFFLDAGTWRVGVALPQSLYIQLGEPVTMDLDTRRPYIYHGVHVKKYPPKHWRKKEKEREREREREREKGGRGRWK